MNRTAEKSIQEMLPPLLQRDAPEPFCWIEELMKGVKKLWQSGNWINNANNYDDED